MKKLSFILVIVLVFAMMPTMAFAAGIQDTASSLKIGDSATGYLHDFTGFAVEIKENGTLTLTVDILNNSTRVELFDKNGKEITAIKAEASVGSASVYGSIKWNDVVEKGSAQLSYKVSQGEYYIRCSWNTGVVWRSGDDEITIKANFTSDSKPATTASSSSGSSTSTSGKTPTTYMAINLKRGQEIQLSAVLTNSTNNTTTWATKNSLIATVSTTGKVKAVAEGSTYISVTANGKTDYLYIRVSK